jgi:DNA topoisomerase-1
MQLAQRLYEAGLITYMRTDSVNLSKDAMEAAQAEIIKSYGKSFLNLELLSIKKGAQKRRRFAQRICRVIRSISIEIKPAYMI